jgi:hypothetical protein
MSSSSSSSSNQQLCKLLGDDSVSSPTICKCICTLSQVCDIIQNATSIGEVDTKRNAMHIITRRPEYKDVDLVVLSPMHGNQCISPCAAALRMASGLEPFWDIMQRLPLHEFLMHWIAFLFLRPIPVYVCIHSEVTGDVCDQLLAVVSRVKHNISIIIQNGMWNCKSRDTMAHSLVQVVLGYNHSSQYTVPQRRE